jgi:hypothetical protein
MTGIRSNGHQVETARTAVAKETGNDSIEGLQFQRWSRTARSSAPLPDSPQLSQ